MTETKPINDSCEGRRAIERLAGTMIDSTWHYSWHWEREHGLTVKGWNTALNDGERLLSELLARTAELGAFMQRMRLVVADVNAEAARDAASARAEEDVARKAGAR